MHMKGWMIEMNFKRNGRQSFEELLSYIFSFIAIAVVGGLIVVALFLFQNCSSDNIRGSNLNSQWGGYYPYKIYTVFDKETGAYYAITSQGGITPMYTIDGEIKLVDQGSDTVVHKNMGEPDAQE